MNRQYNPDTKAALREALSEAFAGQHWVAFKPSRIGKPGEWDHEVKDADNIIRVCLEVLETELAVRTRKIDEILHK